MSRRTHLKNHLAGPSTNHTLPPSISNSRRNQLPNISKYHSKIYSKKKLKSTLITNHIISSLNIKNIRLSCSRTRSKIRPGRGISTPTTSPSSALFRKPIATCRLNAPPKITNWVTNALLANSLFDCVLTTRNPSNWGPTIQTQRLKNTERNHPPSTPLKILTNSSE